MAVRRLGRLGEKSTSLFLCDMQEKFRPSIMYFEEITKTAGRLNELSKILEMPTIVTEQYPKGLGHTVSEVGDISHAQKFEKTCFTMVLPEVEKSLVEAKTKSVILCGIETQACILRTVTDLLDLGVDVHVVADAVSSRSQVDRLYGLATMRQMGAFITTSETVLLQIMGDAAHPKFRQAQKLIRTSAPDSQLLQGVGGGAL